MTEYLCTADCFMDAMGIGSCVHYRRGDIKTFPRKPEAHWLEVEKAVVNYETVTKEVLFASDNWTESEASAYLSRVHGIRIPESIRGRERFIHFFIMSRDRSTVNLKTTDPPRASEILAKETAATSAQKPAEEVVISDVVDKSTK